MLSALVATLPRDFPAPLVIAQHLDPTRASHLTAILARHSALPVHVVEDQEPLEAGKVYIVPSNRHIRVTNHHLSVDVDGAGGPKPSIDLLFRSAAGVFGEGLIAVVLSGLGSDGAAGALRVKEAGGTVVIQNPRTASFPSMPLALAPTVVDAVVDVDAMGTLLYDLLTGAYAPAARREDRQLRSLLADVRDRNGLDFGQYKAPTIHRRLQRRMVATGTRTLREYRGYLDQHPEEFDRLVNSFLIKVTGFFRDPDLFSYLRDVVIPDLIAFGRTRSRELRLWSAGCATGEEAYSLALLAASALGDELESWNVRIFATDLDTEAIEFARRAMYPSGSLENVPGALVERYFTDVGGTFELRKEVRSLVVFGQHDLGMRPPFPRIDLCLCRNVLIYFTADLQRRALELLAFALRQEGYLVLGKAESTNPLPALFVPVHSALRVFRRQGDRVTLPLLQGPEAIAGMFRHRAAPVTPAALELARVRREAQLAQAAQFDADDVLLGLPIGVVVVDGSYDIKRINMQARSLLGIRTAALGEDVVHRVQGISALDLKNAIDAALRGEARTMEPMPTEAVTVGATRYLCVTCVPWRAEQQDPGALILITDETATVLREQSAAQNLAGAEKEVQRLTALVSQARTAHEELLAVNEDLTRQNWQLRSANEKYLLGNEEVQAAAEEVETLNEELQATNEEIETLNEEQQATVEELETTNDELRARHQEAVALAGTADTQRKWLEAIFASMSDAVAVFDAAGMLVFSNESGRRLFVDADAGPQMLDELGARLTAEESPQARARRGEVFEMLFSIQREDGTSHWFDACGRPVREDLGVARGSVLAARDVTERTLRRLQAEFLAMASHELRTPLTAITGFLQLLARGLSSSTGEPGSQTDEWSRYASGALAGAIRLEHLVSDLLDLSRVQLGRLQVVRKPMDLAAAIRNAVDVAAILATDREVRYREPASQVIVDGDPVRLEQVAMNLLANAITYAPDSPVDARLLEVDGEAQFQVQDYGPGVPESVKPHLFYRFRPQDAESAAGRGMGLGLYITRQIVEAHDGTVDVVSIAGQGSTFTVHLPLLAQVDSRPPNADPPT